jgi:hypothetical protein
MTRSAQAISTHMTDFPGSRAAKARVARCQGRAEVTDAEDPLAKIKLHRRRPLPSRPTVIPMGFDGPAWRRFGPPSAPPDRARIWHPRAVSADGERIDGADKPADELRLGHRSPADHPVWWSAIAQSSDADPDQ